MLAPIFAAALVAAAPVQQPAAADSLLRVFVDCPGFVPGCDFDFLRTELTWLDYVRNREDADVHALATTLTTGGGGYEYTVALIGLRSHAGRVDTLRFSVPGTATEDERRRAFARHLGLGLVRYAMGTAAAPRLGLTYRAPEGGAGRPAARVRDPWNSWVFRLGVNGNANGQKLSRSGNQRGSLSANRTTEAWKLVLSANYGESNSRFIFESTDTLGVVLSSDTIRSFNKNYGGSASVVRSLGNHLSARVSGIFSRDTRRNLRSRLNVGPAMEYNFFPYGQSTRRQLTLQAGTGLAYTVYDDTTIYNKIRETRPTANVNLSLAVTQPWGNGSAGIGRNVFLDNLAQSNSFVFAFTSLRLFRGFSVDFSGNYSQVRDQIFLPKGGASRDDLLLQRRALETGYEYFYFFGVSYRFGSTNNNVVNPRFGGGGGGGFFFFN